MQASLDIGSAILMAATLGLFAWVLTDPVLNGARWSRMVATMYSISGGAPFPGAAILLTAVGFNLFGDGFRNLLTRKQEESSHDPTRLDIQQLHLSSRF